MKKHLYLIGIFIGLGLHAQTALYNSGNLRIHENGQIGFHTNLINDASFDQNLGLVGFYGSGSISIAGAFAPLFFDVEIANDNGVTLQTIVNTANNTNFISGDFITPRNQPGIFYNFLEDAFFNGESNRSKINGYAQMTNRENYVFPVGDAQQLRSLVLNSEAINSEARCAYFREDPNAPSSFGSSFNTDRRSIRIGAISTAEFWRLEGAVASTVTLSWNERSDIAALTDDINTLVVMGWSKTGNQWVSLENTALGGDLTSGFITSETFTPNDFEILTFGSTNTPTETLTLDNYYLSPNGDGLNDVLIIPELEFSPNNSVRIFDRFGLKVFDKKNYTNEFDGTADDSSISIAREKGLPAGVYFYLVSLDDLQLNYQGFLYLAR